MELAGRKITKYGIALLGIVLIGAFLRAYHIGAESIWLDEAFSVSISRLTLPQMVQATAADVHPPLYYVLLHYWVTVFGTSESAVRLLSALFGILAIPMIYVVGRQLFNKQVGLLAALILALSRLNITYSQEARMYSLMVLLALLSMYFFWCFLQRSTLLSSACYVLSTTLLIYTHFYGWFVVIAQNIYVVTLLLLSKHRTYRLKYWVALQAIVLALFVPWMTVLINQSSQRIATGANIAAPTTADFIYTFSVYSGTPVLLVLFLGLSVLSLFAYQKVRGSMDWKAPLKALEGFAWEVHFQKAAPLYFLAVWLLTINLIPFIISRLYSPIYQGKYTIAASVALFLLVAKGISNINFRWAKVAVVVIIVVLSGAIVQDYYVTVKKPQGREATGFVDANFKSGDVVLIYPGYHSLVFNYYNNRTDVVVKEDNLQKLQSYVTDHDRVWFFDASYDGRKAAENFTLSTLNQTYAKSYVKSYHGYDVYLFEKRT